MPKFEFNDYKYQNVCQQIIKILLFTMETQQQINLKEDTPQHISRYEKPQIQFYDEFCKVFLANKILSTQISQLMNHKAYLLSILSNPEHKQEEENSHEQCDDKKKKIRRMASQIQRHYQCRVNGCGKSYGSQGSLNQHMKFKHGDVSNYMGMNFITNVKQEFPRNNGLGEKQNRQ